LHPNERGHRLIACRLWDSLAAAGHAVAARPDPEPADPGPTRRDDFLWMATKGTKWFLRRSVDLIPYLLFMAAREALTAPRDWASAASATPVVPVVSGAAGVAGVVGAVGVVGAGWLPGIDETPEPVTE
ncbi:MAG: hypothetical protein WAV12_27480, partial [Trebonia sp.]